MTPKFDQMNGDFLGTYFGYDVYLNKMYMFARWGRRPGQFEVCNVDTLTLYFSSNVFKNDIMYGRL